MVLLENASIEAASRTGLHDLNLASRKAEEAALRRYQAVQWLEGLVGSLGIPGQPSEKEFISCLRNGIILCNAINKIRPGSVPKIVENHLPMHSVTWDSQPLPAYQYFENVRNFLVAVEELKLSAFEASDLEREAYEAGSAGRVVNCILALKAYHEMKQINRGSGACKHMKSPLLPHHGSKNTSWPLNASSANSQRHNDVSAVNDSLALEDSIINALADCMVSAKENIDDNLLASLKTKNMDPVKGLSRILASCMDYKLQNKLELKSNVQDTLKEHTESVVQSTVSKSELHANPSEQHCRACLTKGSCDHWHILRRQEEDLTELRTLLVRTKLEFEHLQSQFLNDLKQLGNQVNDVSTAAVGYHKVMQENRNLYNLVQDLKGNIRVYCRVKPIFDTEAKNVMDFIGDDGSLIVVDPSKMQKDGRKFFQFSRVYGPTATQDEVYKDTQPLIRSVMDGYNVCILAYGQTGSGKTHTMCGPSGGSTKDMGINYCALNDLFEMSNQRKGVVGYKIQAQMVEIYNEQVRDLLAEDSSSTKLEIRNLPGNDGLSLPDAVLHPVNSTDDVLDLMKLGEVNRAVSSTAMNNRSSRSHSILTVHVHGKYKSGSTLHSRLHLVDLAGSERVDKSEVSGDSLKEAQHINKSLSCLGDVFAALSQKCSYIPYRNSKLTMLLQDALGGNAKALMLAHISPEGSDFAETISTLKFAQRVSTVEIGAARVNKQSSEVMELKQQVENLKKALVNKEAQNMPLQKQAISPCDKPKIVNERTPPRSRRLSIENKIEQSSACKKPKSVNERAPLRSRRMSLEHPSVTKSTTISDSIPKSRRLSIEDPRIVKHGPVRYPDSEEKGAVLLQAPRTQRLSIENPHDKNSRRLSSDNSRTMKTEKAQHAEHATMKEHKPSREGKLGTTDRTPPQSRCLSVENPSDMRTETMISQIRKRSTASSATNTYVAEQNFPRVRRLSLEGTNPDAKDHLQIKMSEDVGKCSNTNSDFSSPSPSFTCLGQPTVSDYTMQGPPLFQTPEPIILSGNGFEIAVHGEFNSTTESEASISIRSALGKGSQIRKSLRTIGTIGKIGKLINGSDKRSRKMTGSDANSPLRISSSVLRRRSLTGNQPFVPESLQRSSQGGKSGASETRKGRTPPSLRSSSMTTNLRM